MSLYNEKIESFFFYLFFFNREGINAMVGSDRGSYAKPLYIVKSTQPVLDLYMLLLQTIVLVEKFL